MFTQEQIEENTNTFIKLLKTTNREGIDNLINYLYNETDFFEAPASTKYHGNFKGGLCFHSLEVRRVLKMKNDDYECNVSSESINIVALLHDLCKANFYSKTIKNVKDGKKLNWKNQEVDNWIEKEVWSIDDKLPFGHGQKSVILAQKFIKLTDLEIACILNHMGIPEGGGFIEKNTYHAATKMYPFAVLTFTADYESSIFLEKIVE